MHVKALRPILPQAMNNKVKTYKFCVFTCEQLHSLLGESLYMYLNVLHAQSSEQKRMKLVTWMRGAYSHIRIKRAPPVSVFWVFVWPTPFILTPPV